jgi:hypothetical protein
LALQDPADPRCHTLPDAGLLQEAALIIPLNPLISLQGADEREVVKTTDEHQALRSDVDEHVESHQSSASESAMTSINS